MSVFGIEPFTSDPSLDHFLDLDELFKPVLIHSDKPDVSEKESRMSPMGPVDDKKVDDEVTTTDDKFLIRCNTQGYTLEELSVKIFDNFIMIVGLHDVIQSPNSTRYFLKNWAIPERVQLDEIQCHLNSSTGDLEVEAPRILRC